MRLKNILLFLIFAISIPLTASAQDRAEAPCDETLSGQLTTDDLQLSIDNAITSDQDGEVVICLAPYTNVQFVLGEDEYSFNAGVHMFDADVTIRGSKDGKAYFGNWSVQNGKFLNVRSGSLSVENIIFYTFARDSRMIQVYGNSLLERVENSDFYLLSYGAYGIESTTGDIGTVTDSTFYLYDVTNEVPGSSLTRGIGGYGAEIKQLVNTTIISRGTSDIFMSVRGMKIGKIDNITINASRANRDQFGNSSFFNLSDNTVVGSVSNIYADINSKNSVLFDLRDANIGSLRNVEATLTGESVVFAQMYGLQYLLESVNDQFQGSTIHYMADVKLKASGELDPFLPKNYVIGILEGSDIIFSENIELTGDRNLIEFVEFL